MAAEIEFEPKIGGGSDRLKIVLLCVALAVALGSIVNSLGIVNFGRLLGFSEASKKQSTEIRIARRPAATNPAPAVTKSPQKRATPSAPGRTTSQMGRGNPQKPPETTTPYANPGVTRRRPRPAVPTQRPLTTRQSKSARRSTQKPVASQRPRASGPPSQKPVVVQEPAAPTPSTHKPAVAQKPATTPKSAQTHIVAQAPAQPAPSRREPVIASTSPTPAVPTQKRETSGGEKRFPEEKVSPRPYSVYLGSYKTIERAEKAISEYRKKGITAYWVEVDLGEKGVWHRVFTGSFRDKKEAKAFITKKRLSEGEVKTTRYAALVGVYATEGDLEKKFLDLSRLGFSPYVIETKRGESQLYVGAFYTKAGAEKQSNDLASKGIQSRVVKR